MAKPRTPRPPRTPRTPLLKPAERRERGRLVPDWRVEGKRLVREWTWKDFDEAMAFLDAVAGLARRADHHPDLHLTDYKHVRIESSSHDAGGLTDRDFSLAAEIDALAGAGSGRTVALSRPRRLRR
jgi:4a-hydroxytetrahydrobiopterin dehydratase